MVFEIENTYHLHNEPSPRWRKEDISEMTLAEIISVKRDVVIEVKSPEGTRYLNVMNAIPKLTDYTETLNSLISRLDSTDLVQDLLDRYNFPKLKEVHYYNSVQAGFRSELFDLKTGIEFDSPDAMDDLVVTKDRVDYDLLGKTSLVTVNGLLHNTDADEEGLYVIDGGRTMKRGDMRAIGFLNFISVCDIERIPMSDLTVSSGDGKGLYEYMRISGLDIEGKTALVSLGGMLYMPTPNILRSDGNSAIILQLVNGRYLERLYDSMNETGLVESTPELRRDKIMNIDVAKSDSTIRDIIKQSQSFIILLNSDKVRTDTIKLRDSGVPGNAVMYREPNLPIIARGRLKEYWKRNERGKWGLTYDARYTAQNLKRDISEDSMATISPDADNPKRSELHYLSINVEK